MRCFCLYRAIFLLDILFKGKLFQAGAQLLRLALSYRKLDGARIIKRLIHDAGIHLFHNPHHIIHHRIGEIVGHDFLHLLRHLLAMRQGVYRSFTIRYNQTAGAQFHASEITDYHNENIRQFGFRNLTQDRLARRRRRLTVIVGTEFGALRTQHISITTMSGIVIFLTVSGNNLLHLVNCSNVVSKGEKLTPFLGVISLAHCI